ncbi:hypothetical protein MPSEU_000534200 [Mayamaea pseudoterrestris]|nr:hypothetical protein MPSEU_000534200 [Mayamaea pseudoterrestris]
MNKLHFSKLAISGIILGFSPAMAARDQGAASTTSSAMIRFWSLQLRSALRLTSSTMEQGTERQPMLVINAGNGRTGTSSFVVAMNRLGLKCYHMKEGVIESPGHTEMWTKLMADESITFDQVMDKIANDGFNATADVPMNLFYKELMARYPDAPVILSIRPEDEEHAGSAFQRSMQDTVLQFPMIMADIPFRWVPSIKHLMSFFRAMDQKMASLTDQNVSTKLSESDRLARSYYEFNNDVLQHVPMEKLLIHKATDGWKPLCDHISHVSPIVAANCQEVVAIGEPFPHVNDRQSVQRTQFYLRCITKLTYMLPALLFFAVVVGYRTRKWRIVKRKLD